MSENKIYYPGSEWLYFKIYTGFKTSDILLLDIIKPLVTQLYNENFIKKWFFIRYNDPKPHLRIRFELRDRNYYPIVLHKINSQFLGYLESGEISCILIDTYKKEIERYGENTVENAEELFFLSSELVLNYLEYNNEEKIMVVMFYIDQILSEIGLASELKMKWIKGFDRDFKIEFNANKSLNNQLKRKFLEFIPNYLLFRENEDFADIRNLIKYSTSEISSTAQTIIEQGKRITQSVHLEDYFQSIFHMHINRVFITQQRLFEMIIYDYSLRFYKCYGIT